MTSMLRWKRCGGIGAPDQGRPGDAGGMGRRYTQIFADGKRNQRGSALICVQKF
jgi:hypothetical protein